MICFPNAKINLGLNIVSKRPDGFHNIETVFYPIPIKDALEVISAKVPSFNQTGIDIDTPAEKNLVTKALNLLMGKYALPQMAVYIHKYIPFGAGLGGGSSDAANMLRLVNDYCQLNISDKELEELASGIGADCPFFIQNKPVFASGTGNIFESVDLSLSGFYLCLVKPNITVSTSEAYSMVKPHYPFFSLKETITKPITEWKEIMQNDFETSVFAKFPVIGSIKKSLYREGAIYASMSGSGSSVYGLFEYPTDLKTKFNGCFVWSGQLP
ncbi:MAG: 4-(cytidine 5'-diphospho)-2-C-methyl-D-erythritol kinase [Parabacteroides sp.]|nr:4-(cytidine 5'-diphospho)-2-C-methyl-D-erythritol kinase [Parabacteroides sp.]